MAAAHTDSRRHLFSTVFACALSFIMLAGVDLPRFYALGPGIAGVVLAFAALRFFKVNIFISRPVMVISVATIGLALLSTLWAINPETSFGRAIDLFWVMIPGAVFFAVCRNIDLRCVSPRIGWIGISLCASAALVALEIQTGGALYKILRGMDWNARVYENSYNRGTVAAVLLLFPGMALYRQQATARSTYAVFGACYLAMLLSVESQSAQLATLLGLITFWIFPYRSKYAWPFVSVILVAGMLSAPFLSQWMMHSLAPTLEVMPIIGKGGGYAGARIEIWDYVSRYALQSPWLGFGIEATRTITTFDSAEIYQPGTSILHPHNFALQLWIEFGALGALAGGALCAYIVMMIGKLRPSQARIALPCFVSAISVASTGYGLWQSWWIGLLFMASALCILAIRIEDNPP